MREPHRSLLGLPSSAAGQIRQDRIIADLVALAGDLDVREITVDRWGAVGFLTRLQEHGLPVAQFGQGFASMSAPCNSTMVVVGDCATPWVLNEHVYSSTQQLIADLSER